MSCPPGCSTLQAIRPTYAGNVLHMCLTCFGERVDCSDIFHIPSCTFIYLDIPLYTFIYPQLRAYTLIHLHILENIQYSENEGYHETQKWSYRGPQGIPKGQNLAQTFTPNGTQISPKPTVLKCFGGLIKVHNSINRGSVLMQK